ncbi:MAG: tandem-95 repeat protein, partial [Planctomycetes bacterium]|nr:tandem-95 repeat protein [Planctomycetota bacterium]
MRHFSTLFPRRSRHPQRGPVLSRACRLEPLEDRRLLSLASFQDGVFPTAEYSGTRDAPIFAADADVNFGDALTLRADAEQSSTGEPAWSLFKWDLSGIPDEATINDVSLRVNITNTTVDPGFHLFEVKTPWLESEVTWNGPDANTTWEEPGLIDPADAGTTILATLSGTTLGPLTVSLTAEGVDVVRRWIDDPSSNHGFLLSNADNSNSVRFDSREATTAANRPKLSIDFTFNDVEPPTATLLDPLDNGPADENATAGEVRVGLRDTFVIGLDDYALDDASVTAPALSISKDAAPFTDYTFSFDAASDQITLTPTAGSFDAGLYTITLSSGDSKIADQTGNPMSPTTLVVDIDASLPTTPVAADDTYQTDEDTPLIADPEAGLLDNDFAGNAPGDAVLVSGPSNGTLDLNPDGSFTYTPADNFTGQDSFTYILETPLFTSNVATATIEVSPQSPVPKVDSYTSLEDEPLVVDAASGVLANDSDPQGDEMTAELVSDVAEGTLTLNPDGSFTYQPNENFFGPDSFRYRASDGEHESASTLVQITVENVNDPPLAVDDEYVVEAGETFATPSRYERLILESQPFGYWRLGEASGATTAIDLTGRNDGTYRNFADSDFERTGSISDEVDTAVSFDDGDNFIQLPSGFSDFSNGFSVEVWAFPTAITTWARFIDFGNGPASDNILFARAGDLDVLHFQARVGSANPTEVAAGGAIELNKWQQFVATLLPSGDVSLYKNGKLLVTGKTSVPRNIVRTRNYIGKSNWSENATYRGRMDEVVIYDRAISAAEVEQHFRVGIGETDFTGLEILANDTDLEGDELEAILVDDVSNGTLELTGDGLFTYTPNEGFIGVDTFTYVTSDGQSASNVATVTIKVNGRPNVTNDAYEVAEDNSLVVAAENGVLSDDEDPNADPLTARLVDDVEHGTLALAEDGSFSYTPDADFFGDDSFTYVANDADLDSEPATVTISVAAIDDPTTAVEDSYRVAEDKTLVADVSLYSGVILEDGAIGYWRLGEVTGSVATDESSHGLDGTYTGGVTLDRTGVFGARRNRAATFDGSSGYVAVNPDPRLYGLRNNFTIEAWVYLTTGGTVVSTHVDTGGYTFDVRPDRAVFTFHIVKSYVADQVTIPTSKWTHVAVAIDSSNDASFYVDGQLVQTVIGNAANIVRPLPFHIGRLPTLPSFAGGGYSYFGGALDEVAIFNRALTAQEIKTHYVVATVNGVLDNDLDVDRDELLATIVDGVDHGTLDFKPDGTFTYTPNENFNGTDSFTYRVDDGTSISNLVTATIDVQPINDPPVANDDEGYEVDEDGHLVVIASEGVLTNDDDVDSDTLTAKLVGNVSHGTLVLGVNGSFTYTPDADFVGTDTFAYRAGDGQLESDPATVTINVVGMAPVARTDEYTINEDEELVVDAGAGVLANDFDPQSDAMTAVLARDVNDGTLTLNRDGSFTYQPNENFTGTDSFLYRASDGEHESANTLVQIAINVAPLAVDDAYEVDLGKTLVTSAGAVALGVLANDVDMNGDTLTAQMVDDVQHGTLDLSADGTFTYTPLENFVGIDSFTYRASDGQLFSNLATVTIRIEAPPLAGDDEYEVEQNQTLVVDAADGVLSNDTDPNGDAIAAILVSSPQHGSLSLSLSGAFTYTPDADFIGTDSFAYRPSDGERDGEPATVTIVVGRKLVDVALVAVVQPSGEETLGELPASLSEIAAGTSYFVEVWVQDIDAPGVGISGGTVDLGYNTAPADVTALSHGSLFNFLTTGEIDDPTGLVDDFGGGTFEAGVGIAPTWARLGYVEVSATAAGPVTFTLAEGRSAFGLSGLGNVPWDKVDLSSTLTVEQVGGLVLFDMTVVRQPTNVDALGQTKTLAKDAEFLHEWESYWVEVWVSTPDDDGVGIAGGTLDLSYDTARFTATQIKYGAAFPDQISGTIDDAAGLIRNLGALTTRG